MTSTPVLLWLRNDFRFADNPAMRAAADSGRPVLCIYVLEDAAPGSFGMGGAQGWWLHHSLSAFAQALSAKGGALTLRRGDPRTIIPHLTETLGIDQVYWNRRYMPWETEIDTAIKSALSDQGVSVTSCSGRLLAEPWEVSTKTGAPYRVFTPFWRALQAGPAIRPPAARVEHLPAPDTLPPSDRLEDWALQPTAPNWARGFAPVWTPGEDGAHDRLTLWMDEAAKGYASERDRPDLDTTSRLSPHLHFGEISPVSLWHSVHGAMAQGSVNAGDGQKFLAEVGWREFSYQLLFHNPSMTSAPLQQAFAQFEWSGTDADFAKWTTGQTGYPIVDAGMRQLWQTGWMHNRVRMIVASFLIKDLFIDWQRGMEWFWDTLVDADPASNTASWQWVAGCGADAAPFFRIFNPTTQGEKFDPDGAYVRKFVPELAPLPTKYIHAPSAAPAETLRKAGITLGKTYPPPMVEHAQARKMALARYEAVKLAKA